MNETLLRQLTIARRSGVGEAALMMLLHLYPREGEVVKYLIAGSVLLGNKSTAARAIDVLHDHGLLKKHMDNDKRRIRIKLTAAGHNFVKSLEEA